MLTRVDLAPDVVLYRGDCRAILRDLAGSIDAIVTDPPYGISFEKGDGGRAHMNGRAIARQSWGMIRGDDAPFDPSHLLSAAPDIVLWGADHYAAMLPRGRWIAWDKLDGRESWDSFSDVEFAWHNRPGAARIFRHLWKGVVRTGEKGRKAHPNQKPTALMARCIAIIGDRARTIADPYMGSGSTGIAAIEAGRGFVGIELDPHYFDVARRRLGEALARRAAL